MGGHGEAAGQVLREGIGIWHGDFQGDLFVGNALGAAGF